MTWHIDAPTWQAYAAGRLEPPAEAAVETHVTGCPECRSGARALVPETTRLWEAVHTEIAAPRLPWPMRLLARHGVPEADLLILAAARDLLTSWSVAVGAALVCAFATGLAPIHSEGGRTTLFLMLAPLVPVLAVVAAYDATDPFREVTEASPYSSLRLALLRTAAALTVAIPLTVVVSLSIPALDGYFATWLLPGLALTIMTLLLLTWLTAWVASAVVCAGWVGSVWLASAGGSVGAMTSASGQLAFGVAVLALGALLIRASTVQHARGVLL